VRERRLSSLVQEKEEEVEMRNVLMMVLMFAVADGVGGAEPMAAGDAPVKARVSLVDGSQLTGTLLSQSLELTTGFGKVNIPLAQVLTLDLAKGTAKVGLANKDVLSGTLEGTALKIGAAFGNVELPYAQIKTISFVRPQDEKVVVAEAPKPPPQAPAPVPRPVQVTRPNPHARMYDNLPEPPEGKVWLKIEYPKPQFGF